MEYMSASAVPGVVTPPAAAGRLAVEVKGVRIANLVELSGPSLAAGPAWQLDERERQIAGRSSARSSRGGVSLHRGAGLSEPGPLFGHAYRAARRSAFAWPRRSVRLRGVLYVLDEPSIGLHPRDNNKLLDTLARLRDLGNTCWWCGTRRRDQIERARLRLIDLRPGAGRLGEN